MGVQVSVPGAYDSTAAVLVPPVRMPPRAYSFPLNDTASKSARPVSMDERVAHPLVAGSYS